jgi:nicotinate dehydrogenase subunit A
MTAAVEFDVNGERHRVEDGATPLLLALRGDLGLRGTRHGCATGNCGACTVLVGGRAMTSCNTPSEAVSGQSIETIEALGGDAIGDVLLTAFMTEQAGQCGYCVAGILVEAKALLAKNGSPSRAEIATALDGHLCRCGSHHRILNAIERAAGELTEGKTA